MYRKKGAVLKGHTPRTCKKDTLNSRYKELSRSQLTLLATHGATNRHHNRPATNSCDSESLPEESRGGSMVKAIKACNHPLGPPIHTNKKGHKHPYRRMKNQTHEGPSRRHGRLLLAPHDAPPLRMSRRRSAKPEPPEEERGNFYSSGRRRKEKIQKRGKGRQPRLLAFGPQDATGWGITLPTVTRRSPRSRPECAHPRRRDNPIGQSTTPATLTGVR
ncbi:hypothetical protein Taro_026661 [Colocasia esculenta]|uniref:Uncharacterized protein n=1 Tax=Colocasia esculenta TaxID=4460 RepID=A0A843VBZ3_COLES|nr:hypothetical protein [Colocasia esculenta]